MKKALVFGASGQAGYYLCKLLQNRGYEVYGTYYRHRPDTPDFNGVHWSLCNSVDSLQLLSVFHKVWPDEVYNLASLMYAPASWDAPHQYTQVNYWSVVAIVDMISRHKPETKLFQAGSAEALNPRNPYGIAKAAAFDIIRCYREHKKLFACTGVFYNMESPMRASSFFTRKVAIEVVKLKIALDHGVNPNKIKLGKLHAVRDWGYTPEFMEAAYTMMQAASPMDYVVATGVHASCRAFVQEALSVVGLSTGSLQDYVDFEPSLPDETDIIKGDPSAIHKALGWSAKVHWNDLVHILVSAELKRPNGESTIA